MEITQIKPNIFRIRSITGNKQYVAKITGLDNKYGFKREFLAYQKPRVGSRVDKTLKIDNGTIIEKRDYSHGGNVRLKEYYNVVDGVLTRISEKEAIKLIT
ncbi:MAG: hypothetical protein ACTSPV_12385 [Candidatus Hodarchaeales archaeon]